MLLFFAAGSQVQRAAYESGKLAMDIAACTCWLMSKITHHRFQCIKLRELYIA